MAAPHPGGLHHVQPGLPRSLKYSLGAAGGLKHDLGIGAGAAALLGALFFLGYFFFQIPAAHYAEHKSVKRLVFGCLLL